MAHSARGTPRSEASQKEMMECTDACMTEPSADVTGSVQMESGLVERRDARGDAGTTGGALPFGAPFLHVWSTNLGGTRFGRPLL